MDFDKIILVLLFRRLVLISNKNYQDDPNLHQAIEVFSVVVCLTFFYLSLTIYLYSFSTVVIAKSIF